MSVRSDQRFTDSSNSCPICSGHQKLPRGQGSRCFGFLSEDGKWPLHP